MACAIHSLTARPTFYFDLASPFTYLAAERVDRTMSGVQWAPAACDALQCHAFMCEIARAEIARRAHALELPLVWPVHPGIRVAATMRVATLAAERGRAAAFVLAASRLAYCGGYDVEDPEILAEAAAAAEIEFDEMLRVACDGARDAAIEANGRKLVAVGADRLPALGVGRLLFCGEERMAEAASAARAVRSRGPH